MFCLFPLVLLLSISLWLVNQGVSEDINTAVATLIDWLVTKSNRQAQNIARYLQQRNRVYTAEAHKVVDSSFRHSSSTPFSPSTSSSLPPSSAPPTDPSSILGLQFHSTHQSLLHNFQRDVRDLMAKRERERQVDSEDLSNEIRKSLLATAAVEAGALGLAAAMTAALMDWTGVAGASVVALMGLYVVPRKRARLKSDMKLRIETLEKRCVFSWK